MDSAAEGPLIRLAISEREYDVCAPVMLQLRPHLTRSMLVTQMRQQSLEGYQLAYLTTASGHIACAAGFRLLRNLAWGRFLYVDDLVTAEEERSRGHGAAMLRWLEARARQDGCAALHLDSGVQRESAHRFYKREGLAISSYHFQKLF